MGAEIGVKRAKRGELRRQKEGGRGRGKGGPCDKGLLRGGKKEAEVKAGLR